MNIYIFGRYLYTLCLQKFPGLNFHSQRLMNLNVLIHTLLNTAHDMTFLPFSTHGK